MPAGQLGIVFTLTSEAAGLSRGFRQANAEMSGFQQRARAFGRAAAVPLAAVGVAAGRAAVQLVGEFEQAQKSIAQATGATGAELQGLTDDMRAAFGQVPQSMGEVADAIGTINTRFGSTGQTLQDQTRLFLDFSRVTGTEVSTAVSTLAAQLTNFGEPASSLNETLGDMVRIQQETGLAGADMARQFNEYGPLFANLNLTVEQTAAVFGQLAQSNIAVSRIAPGLNAFIRNASALGKDPLTALRDVVDEIRDAANFTDALNAATEAFGAEGAQRMTTAIRAGNFDIREFNGLLGVGQGIVAQQGEEMLTLGERFQRVGNSIKASATPALAGFANAAADALETLRAQGFGAAVSQTFDQITDSIDRMTPRLIDWARENTGAATSIAAVAGGLALWVARRHPVIGAISGIALAMQGLNQENTVAQVGMIGVGVALTGLSVAAAAAAGRFNLLTLAVAGFAAAAAWASGNRENDRERVFGTAITSAIGGATVGGAIGSVIPGVGTGLGALVGGAAGFVGGAGYELLFGQNADPSIPFDPSVITGTRDGRGFTPWTPPGSSGFSIDGQGPAASGQVAAVTAMTTAASAQESAAEAQETAAAAMLASLGPESEFGDLLRREDTDTSRTFADFMAQEQDRQEFVEEQANSFNGFRRDYNRETDRQIQAVLDNTKLSSAERAQQVTEIKANRENATAFGNAYISAALGVGEDTRWVGAQVEGLGPHLDAGFSDLSDTVKGLANLPLPTVNVINELKPVAPQINWNPVYNIAVNDVKRATAIVTDIQTQINQGVILEDVVGRLFAGALR